MNTIKPLQRFWKLISLEKRELLHIYFFATLSGLIYLSIPIGIQSIINQLFGGLVSTSLVVMILVVVLGVVINGWLVILQMKSNERIQRRIFTRVSLQFAYKIPRLDLVAIDGYYLPELVNRFFDTASLQKGLTKVLIEFPSASIQILFGLLLLSLYHPSFLAFGIVLLGLVFLILRITYPKGIATSLEESNYKYEVGYWLEEVARTIKTLKFMGKNDFPAHKTDVLVSGYLDARKEHFKVLKIQYWAFVIFKVFITAALLTLGAALVINQQINIGQFIASEIVIIMLLNSIEKVIGSLDVVYDMLTSLEKVSKILDKPIEKENGFDMIEFGENAGIQIKAENFSYRFNENETYVLQNLNFEIKAGEKVCIWGAQGSGKSTLLKLLTGAYSNYEGNLLFNQFPIGSYNLQKLRQKIGVYLNSADVFSGSLYENLTLGNTTISKSFILEKATETGLIDFIQSQREGLNTRVDSVGKKLPRNTVNKIQLTRALIGKPSLLLLEDCWSSLENSEYKTIVKNLTGPKNRNVTMVAVSNDEFFASNCDKIILLENGKILTIGDFDSLRNSIEFRKMFKDQNFK